MLEVFSEVDVFRAGTFKFETNHNYDPDISNFEAKQRESKIKDLERTGEINDLSKEQIEFRVKLHIDEKKFYMRPHVKYFKKFVPIFPFLYTTLDCGLSLGRRYGLRLTG